VRDASPVSHLRGIVGQRQKDLELPSDSVVDTALSILVKRYPDARPVVYFREGLAIRLLLNGRDARPDESLVDGSELALLPPVGGGAV
jgi:molybdopterin converting factor small subunit